MPKKKVEVVSEDTVEEVEVEIKATCPKCGGHVSNESFVAERGRKFCSLGCANS